MRAGSTMPRRRTSCFMGARLHCEYSHARVRRTRLGLSPAHGRPEVRRTRRVPFLPRTKALQIRERPSHRARSAPAGAAGSRSMARAIAQSQTARGVELAHDVIRAVCGRADHPLARPVMLLSWRAALALARGAAMHLGTACSYHTLALTSAALSGMRGVPPTREPVCGMRMRVPAAFLLPPLKSVGEEDGSAAMLCRAV